MDKKGILLVTALICLALPLFAQAAKADSVTNASVTPYATAPLASDMSAAQTPWTIIALVVLLVAVYVALIVLISKRPK